jgi:hypothetical protein|tara:strand:+ start:111 stop:431 length:321 start_codon:yes stop_codon:yes gene_type:complete
MNTRSSDMDLITDMFDTPYDDDIESNMDEHYYVGKAENILKQLDEKTYLIFLKTILKNYHSLNVDQKDEIVKFLDINPVDRVVYVEKNTKKKNNVKPKLNMRYDDY